MRDFFVVCEKLHAQWIMIKWFFFWLEMREKKIGLFLYLCSLV